MRDAFATFGEKAEAPVGSRRYGGVFVGAGLAPALGVSTATNSAMRRCCAMFVPSVCRARELHRDRRRAQQAAPLRFARLEKIAI